MEKRIAAAKTEDEKKKWQVILNQADSYDKDELMAVFEEHKVLAPSGGKLTEPEPFNLMFKTNIGPVGNEIGFLRPETAQGIFLNYKFCKEQNSERMPFGERLLRDYVEALLTGPIFMKI